MMEKIAGFYLPKTEPFKHQRLGLEECWDEPGWGWLWEMGTGKSKILIDNICMLREAESLDCAVIFAPKGVYTNWFYSEIPKHMPDRHLRTTLIHLWRGGGSQSEQKELKSFLRKGPFLRILIMNTEAISQSTRAWDYIQKFAVSGKCLAAVDEASTIKNPDAIRTKKIIKIGRLTAYRRILTGTPVTRSPLDLWAEFEFLNPACLGFRSYYAFRAKFAVVEKTEMRGRMVDVVVAHRDTETLSRIVAEHASVARAEDCLDLPPVVPFIRYVEMTDEQTRLYSDLMTYAAAELESGEFVSTPQIIVMYLRLHQILCGHVPDENKMIHDIPTNRLDVLEEAIEETSGRSLVWCHFQRDVEQVAERLRKMDRRVVTYYGKSTPEECEEAKFRLQGEIPVVVGGQVVDMKYCPDHLRADAFVGTPAKGGYGLTLTAARNTIYYSCGPNAEHRWQSEKRNHRYGQQFTVNQIDLYCKGTVEEKYVEGLKVKKTLADVVMNGPARVREFFT